MAEHLPTRRIYAGHRLRELRVRAGLSQADMASQLTISPPYLSQIEAGDRPLTPAVLAALAKSFPDDWADVARDETEATYVALLEAANDPLVPGEHVAESSVRKALRHHPALSRRLVAVHQAYRRSLDQLQVLDDRVGSAAPGGDPLPWEDVRDWFQDIGNYVDELDRAAEMLAAELGRDRVPTTALAARLADRHGVAVASFAPGEGDRFRLFEPDQRTLRIDSSLALESQRFQLAHQLMRLEAPEVIAALVSQANLRTLAARELLSVGLANYAAGALLMPYSAYRDAALTVRHDIDQLRSRFEVSFEQACHRLSTLQRPGARGIPVFFCRVDMAGNITKRHSATQLQFARFGGACPLWIVHEAVAIPDRLLVQVAETPDGMRYLTIAKGHVKPVSSYRRLPRRYAIALGCEVEDARHFIYGDGLDLEGPSSATPVGISCRICPREDCDQRAFPPAGRELHVNPEERRIIPYRFS